MKSRFKELRAKRGLKQKEVCKIVGVDIKTYRNYEKDFNTHIPVNVCIILSKLYNVSIEYLLCLDDAEHWEDKYKETIKTKTEIIEKTTETLTRAIELLKGVSE